MFSIAVMIISVFSLNTYDKKYSSMKGTPIPEIKSTAKQLPTITLTVSSMPILLGNPTNPVVMGIVSESIDPEVINSVDDLAFQLEEHSEYTIICKIYPTDNSLLVEMENGIVHLAWLPPFTYLWANENDFAQVVFITNDFGVYKYGTQFLARSDSGFTTYYDSASDQNSGDAATALEQFPGKRPCWVDSTSASCFVTPVGILNENGIEFQDGVFAITHSAIVRALYIKGICDFGATFTISGDPRTSSSVLDDLPDDIQHIEIIWRSEVIIPNLNLSFLSELLEEIHKNFINSIQEIITTENSKEIITAVNNYDIQDLLLAEDTIYDPLRNMVKQTEVDLETLIGN